MGKKKSDYSTGDVEASVNPFGALAGLRGDLPKGENPAPPEPDAPSMPRFAAKVVIRRERSGRGGKTVTVVEGVQLEGEQRAAFVRDLRKALGTSGRVEGDDLVFGGDMGASLAGLLEQAGARRVVRGN